MTLKEMYDELVLLECRNYTTCEPLLEVMGESRMISLRKQIEAMENESGS